MRLIDADELKDWSEIVPLTGDGGIDINDFDEKLKSMPTVDAVPVIRCKDCKWLGVANLKDKYGQPNPVACCRGNGNVRIGIKPDDYCSRAERKEE